MKTMKEKEKRESRRGAAFAGENIGRPDGVFILPRWSSLAAHTDFQVYFFDQLSYC